MMFRSAARSSGGSSADGGEVVTEGILGGVQGAPGDAVDEQVVDGYVEGLGEPDEGFCGGCDRPAS